MSKILLSSDWHIKFNAPFNTINSEGRSSRIDEILTSISWAANEGIRRGAEYFISLGDMFENSDKLPTREGLYIHDCLSEVSSMYGKRNHIALRGNHCSLSEDCSIVSLFNNTLIPINTPTVLDIDGGRLFFCPYQRDPEDLYNTLRNFETKDTLGNKYLLGHFWTSDVMAVDSDAIDLDKFNVRFYNRLLLGHYHANSGTNDNLVTYVGTLLNKTFGETGPKGAWLLDTENNDLEFLPNPNSPEFFTTEDHVILNNPTIVNPNAYYKVATAAESITDLTRILSVCKGFELVSKTAEQTSSDVSIDVIEKNNSLSLKDFIFKNASLYCPENIELDSFISRGKELLGGL